ncbi:MAG: hypothetical protein U0802_08635 [Candidatus Binatia bacterium]
MDDALGGLALHLAAAGAAPGARLRLGPGGLEVTFAERLTGAGFVGAGFTANWRLTEALGYAQGFATWRGFLDSPGSPRKARRGGQRRRPGMDRRQAGGGCAARTPRFLYLQYMEPHVPLEPPAEVRARFAAEVSAEEGIVLNQWALMLSPFREAAAGGDCPSDRALRRRGGDDGRRARPPLRRPHAARRCSSTRC